MALNRKKKIIIAVAAVALLAFRGSRVESLQVGEVTP